MTNQPDDDQTITRLRSHAERLAAWKSRAKEETRLAWCQIIANEPLGITVAPDEAGPVHPIL